MPSKQILIVSPHGLFREGLGKILLDTADLTPARQTDSLQEAEELVRNHQIDIIIIDQAEGIGNQARSQESISRLLSLSDARIIAVSLQTGDMCVYQRKRVKQASVDDLMAALTD